MKVGVYMVRRVPLMQFWKEHINIIEEEEYDELADLFEEVYGIRWYEYYIKYLKKHINNKIQKLKIKFLNYNISSLNEDDENSLFDFIILLAQQGLKNEINASCII